MTVADILVRALALPPLEKPPSALPHGSFCAITGAPIALGYAVSEITTSATNEFVDTFRGEAAGHVSETAGRLFRQDHNMGARLAFADGSLYHPLISRQSAADQSRPCWSDLVRSIYPARIGQAFVCILTTDTKKRLWPRARVGVLGADASIYIHDSRACISAPITLNWPALLACLDLLEQAYALGFAKPAIETNLLTAWKAVATIGHAAALALERRIDPLRRTPEFKPALLIAQKPSAPCFPLPVSGRGRGG